MHARVSVIGGPRATRDTRHETRIYRVWYSIEEEEEDEDEDRGRRLLHIPYIPSSSLTWDRGDRGERSRGGSSGSRRVQSRTEPSALRPPHSKGCPKLNLYFICLPPSRTASSIGSVANVPILYIESRCKHTHRLVARPSSPLLYFTLLSAPVHVRVHDHVWYSQ